MLFNSFEFIVFFAVVFLMHWFVFKKSYYSQNILILVSSYFFYGWWDFRFLSLIFLSTLTDYTIGICLGKTIKDKIRKRLLFCSLLFNLGLLGVFKYYNFFIDSFVEGFSFFNVQISLSTINIILPVGISFYTFQTLSYTIDVYRKKLSPLSDFISFATFVAFFPQLVAGPIERATNLIPQLLNKRKFNYLQSVQGIRLIIYGMFKKVVIADSLAFMVDRIFEDYTQFDGGVLWLGAIYFAIQIYCDFSGYSDIAIGTAKLFGIELMSNFKFPYFSRNIGEFWRRWHISLSSWFQAYIYVPLGGSRQGKYKTIINVFIVFLISGFWHGANWTFILWGILHAVIFIPLLVLGQNTKYKNTILAEHSKLPSLKEFFSVLSVFSIVTFCWIFFRSESITDAFGFIGRIFTDFSYLSYSHPMGYRMIDYYILILFFVFYEFLIRKDERSPFNFKSKVLRFIIYAVIIFCMLLFYDDNIDRSFIYFQF